MSRRGRRRSQDAEIYDNAKSKWHWAFRPHATWSYIVRSSSLAVLLSERKVELVSKWLDQMLLQYPAVNKKDQFQNPVGYRLKEGLSLLFDSLISPDDVDGVRQALERIVKIGAVQNFSAAQAVAFVFALKTIIRKQFAAEIMSRLDEIIAIENRTDAMALLAFDLYVQCREQIYELKTKEISRMNFLSERMQSNENK
jgi:hypothetical protein